MTDPATPIEQPPVEVALKPPVVVHALPLPAPLHNPQTLCGLSLRDAAESHPGHEIVGVKQETDRNVAKVTCEVCRIMMGRFTEHMRERIGKYPLSLPQVEDIGEDGTFTSSAQGFALDWAGQFLATMKEAKAQNFLSWRWDMTMLRGEEFEAMRAANPETEWDTIEIVTYCRKGSGLSPEDLVAAQREEIRAAWLAMGAPDDVIESPRQTLADAVTIRMELLRTLLESAIEGVAITRDEASRMLALLKGEAVAEPGESVVEFVERLRAEQGAEATT